MVKYGYKAQIRLSTKRAVRERSIKIFLTKEKTKMKKRRTLIIALLLIAALALGIGYAAVTDTLTIGGNATVKPHQENLKVEFTDIKDQTKCTATIQTDKTVATFTTTQLVNGGDTASATFVVTNSSPEYSATIAPPQINLTTGPSDYFDITTNFGTETKTIAKGGSIEFTVTVTLKKAVVEDQGCEFTIVNDVTAVEATPAP